MLAVTTGRDIVSEEYFSNTKIDDFIASRHASKNTAKTYRNALRQLHNFFNAQGITAPTENAVNAFVNNLLATGKSPSTVRLYTSTTKNYFAWLDRHGYYPDVAADVRLNLRKSTTHAKKALSTEQAQRLLNAVKGDTLIARRDRAIIALALQTGVRTVEISRANVGDLYREDDDWYLDVQGKGRIKKDATVRVASEVAELILAYLSKRGNVAGSDPLFTSASRNINWQKNSYGSRLSEQSVGKIIKRSMVAVGIDSPKLTAHSCRHFAATTAITAGVDIREVSAMLRHKSIVVTAIYLHDLSVKTRRAEIAVASSLFKNRLKG